MNLDRLRVQRQPGHGFDERPLEAAATAKHPVADTGAVRLLALPTREHDDLVRLADDHVGLDEADQAEDREPAQPDCDTDDLRLVHLEFLSTVSPSGQTLKYRENSPGCGRRRMKSISCSRLCSIQASITSAVKTSSCRRNS